MDIKLKKVARIISLSVVMATIVMASSALFAQDKPSAKAVSVTAEETAESDESAPVKDPYEGFNRAMFSFNETIDKYFLKPVSRGYNAIMPRPLNQGVHNFFVNIGTIPTVINDVLQFNFFQAANDSWRLLINSTVGIGGLFDIAGRIDLKPYVNDFGLTLARWGWADSNYLVLPFLGPSTPRDGLIGLPVDYYLFSVYPRIHPDRTRYALLALFVIDRRAQLLQYQDVYEAAALDKYVFIRNAYLQKRKSQIEENQHRTYDDLAYDNAVEPTATAGGEEVSSGIEENIVTQ